MTKSGIYGRPFAATCGIDRPVIYFFSAAVQIRRHGQRLSDFRTAAYSSAARATPTASKSGVSVPANSA